jgi:hypothetical protein
MFIRTLNGDWINTDHITYFDVVRTADNVFTSRAFMDDEHFAVHKANRDADAMSRAEEQSWLDCYIHKIGLD